MNITVIGAGPGGYEAAIYAAKCGASVTLVEKASVGGTCLNVGCIPTKALLAASDALRATQHAKDFAITLPGPPVQDYAGVVARKDKVVKTLVSGVERTLEANGVRLVRGAATLAAANTVRVALNDGGSEEIRSDAILLATGSVPGAPPALPVDGETFLNSDHLLALTTPPASLIIAGGGVIGCEIGQFLARCGTAVTIVEMLPQLLPLEDADVAKALDRQFRRDKIKTFTGMAIATVEKTAAGVRATLADGTVLEAEKMLVVTGRKPYTQGLGLENVGLETDRKGCIPVDAAMQTKVAGIYAIGDIVDTPQLAHLATKEGFTAVDNMLGVPTQMDYRAVPRCVYTHPEIAAVGPTLRTLQESGVPHTVGRFDTIANGKAKASGQTDGFAQVLVDENDVILGAAIVGAHATDMITLLTLAVAQGLTAAQVGQTIFPHPTLSEVVMEALHDVHGKSVHKL